MTFGRSYDDGLLDITAPEIVQVTIRDDLLWVATEDGTVLRCCRIGQLEIVDERTVAPTTEAQARAVRDRLREQRTYPPSLMQIQRVLDARSTT